MPRKLSLPLLALLACCHLAQAEDGRGPVDALWLTPGLLSRHFDRGAGYRENNWGLGLQAEVSGELAVLAGSFINSDGPRSRYAGVLWQPLDLGFAKLGLYATAIDGYPRMRNGGWFAAALPVASLRYGRAGVNLMVVPSYGDRLHGAIAAQFLYRIW